MSTGTRKTIALAALLLGIGLAVPLLAVFFLIGAPWWLAPIIGFGVALGFVMLRIRRADQYVLSKLGGTLVSEDDIPRFANLLEGLSLRAGVTEPDVYVVDDPACNAASVMVEDRSSIVVTKGLLDTLNRLELEAVAAELLVRLKSGDAFAATIGAALFGIPLIDTPLAGAAKPLAAWAIGRLITPDRDIEADMAAVALTRYPPGLQSALTRISHASALPAKATAGSQHLWLVTDHTARTVVPFSPLEWRIEVLTEL